jgi:hypothetical protein
MSGPMMMQHEQNDVRPKLVGMIADSMPEITSLSHPGKMHKKAVKITGYAFYNDLYNIFDDAHSWCGYIAYAPILCIISILVRFGLPLVQGLTNPFHCVHWRRCMRQRRAL